MKSILILVIILLILTLLPCLLKMKERYDGPATLWSNTFTDPSIIGSNLGSYGALLNEYTWSGLVEESGNQITFSTTGYDNTAHINLCDPGTLPSYTPAMGGCTDNWIIKSLTVSSIGTPYYIYSAKLVPSNPAFRYTIDLYYNKNVSTALQLTLHLMDSSNNPVTNVALLLYPSV